jgi:sarcosine oxidase delta subunit
MAEVTYEFSKAGSAHIQKSVGGRERRERRWIEEVYMTGVPSGISASRDAETHHVGNNPKGAESTQRKGI